MYSFFLEIIVFVRYNKCKLSFLFENKVILLKECTEMDISQVEIYNQQVAEQRAQRDKDYAEYEAAGGPALEEAVNEAIREARENFG